MNGSVTSNALDLLRRLEPAVRPGAGGAAGGSGAVKGGAAALFESQSFDDLLSGVFTGEVRSGREVQVAGEVLPQLDASQLERLGAAADLVEASGAKRALMMLDGRGLVMDVATRSVVAEMKPGDVGGILQVDAAMVVASASGASGGAGGGAGKANGSPFAGLNALTSARINSATETMARNALAVSQAQELIAPNSRSAR